MQITCFPKSVPWESFLDNPHKIRVGGRGAERGIKYTETEAADYAVSGGSEFEGEMGKKGLLPHLIYLWICIIYTPFWSVIQTFVIYR